MAGKEHRHELILKVVDAGQAHTQADLLAALRSRRIEIDQSTLSRDLTELGISKAGGRYVSGGNGHDQAKAHIDYSSAVRSFTACGPHLIVISTETGQAQPVALQIEAANEPTIVATLGGDDTIFLATKSQRSQLVAIRRLKTWFGDKNVP